MNWIKELYDTYENLEGFAGKKIQGNILLPISHTWVNCHIDCILKEDGTFFNAYVIPKVDAATMIPCTIESANRTSKPTPHPLFDSLSYIAKELKIKVKNKDEFLYDMYIAQLRDWIKQSEAPRSLKLLYKYLEGGTIIEDLTKANILYQENGELMEKWTGNSEEKPEIFKVLSGGLVKAYVRFSIRCKETGEVSPIWMDHNVQKSFLEYYLPTLRNKNLCMVTGEIGPVTELHSAYLRFPGDSAKLISSQDNLGFKYTGRNREALEAVSVSYEASQKAHNALKWLIQRQAFKMDGYISLVWGTKEPEVMKGTEGSLSIFKKKETLPFTYAQYADDLKLLLKGYYQERFFYPEENVVVMCMDAATKGRLAILFYQSLRGSQFLERIGDWYRTVSWNDIVFYKEDKETGKFKKRFCTGSPSFRSIIEALYGTVDSDDMKKIKKSAYTTLMACMIDGRPLPRDYIQIIVDKFSRPQRLKKEMPQDELLSIACALIRKYRNDLEPGKEEVWKVDIDYNQKQTYYLWGRLLAYAEWMERRANKLSGEEREVNATKYRFEFEHHPAKAWKVISDKLIPYRRKFIRAGKKKELEDLEERMGFIMQILEKREENTEPLDERYILGYGAQLYELKQEEKENNKK